MLDEIKQSQTEILNQERAMNEQLLEGLMSNLRRMINVSPKVETQALPSITMKGYKNPRVTEVTEQGDGDTGKTEENQKKRNLDKVEKPRPIPKIISTETITQSPFVSRHIKQSQSVKTVCQQRAGRVNTAS